MEHLWEILVPTAYRESGIIYPLAHHQAWDAKVRAISKGLTILKPVKGQWVSEDENLHAERMIPVRILCSEGQIRDIAQMTLVHYDQIEVMYYRISAEAYTVRHKPPH